MTERLPLAASLALFAIVGCSTTSTSTSTSAPDAAEPWTVDAPELDARDTADAPDAYDPTLCVVTETESCAPVEPSPVLYDAKAIGAKIVALRPPHALLDPPRVLRFWRGAVEDELVPSGEEATWSAIGLGADRRPGALGPFVLLCGGEACRVLSVEGEALARIGEPLPSSTRAIAVLEGEPWVAGHGVRRFDGTTFRLELEEGRFDVIAADRRLDESPLVVAAGDDGRVAVRAGGAWSWISLPSHDPIVQASVSRGTILLVGGSGTLYFGTAAGVRACSGTPLDAAWAELSREGPGDIVGITRDARPFVWHSSGTACLGAKAADLRAVTHHVCGLARNEWRATADTLFGTAFCAVD